MTAREALLQARNTLETRRPVGEAAAIASSHLATSGVPGSSGVEEAKAWLREAALDRVRRECAAPEHDPLASGREALRALTLAADAGAALSELDARLVGSLAVVLRAANRDTRSSREPDRFDRPAEVLEAAASAIRAGAAQGELVAVVMDLAETCDTIPRSPALEAAQAALEAACVARPHLARPPYVLGKLLSHRVQVEDRLDLLERACERLEQARARAAETDLNWSVNEWGISLVISARLEELAGRPQRALELLTREVPEPVRRVRDGEDAENAGIGAHACYLRARARLALGQRDPAITELRDAAGRMLRLRMAPRTAAAVAEALERIREAADDRALRAIAAKLPQLAPL